MTNIVLVCVAAVSGTFLARRLRDAMPEADIRVSTIGAIAQTVPGADVVLAAPQVADRAAEIRELAGGRPVLEMDADDYAPEGAARVVASVAAILGGVAPTDRVEE